MPICAACWPLPSVLPPRPCCEKPHRPTIFIFYVHSPHCLAVLAVMCATGQPRKSPDIQTENRDKNSLTDLEIGVMCASCTGRASERWSANAGTPLCPGGGIGRRAGFRCQWPLWPWKFESSPGHHLRWFICHNQSNCFASCVCMAIGVKQDEKQICIKFAT